MVFKEYLVLEGVIRGMRVIRGLWFGGGYQRDWSYQRTLIGRVSEILELSESSGWRGTIRIFRIVGIGALLFWERGEVHADESEGIVVGILEDAFA